MDGLTYKGIPLGLDFTASEFETGRLDVRAGDLATPVATLRQSALEANAIAMRDYCAAHGVQLAPHAKTTLAAGLLDVQRRHGVWAMTAALPRQVALLWQLGFGRVLLANEVTDPAALRWFTEQLAADSDRLLYLYADSIRGVELLADAAQRIGADRFRVLIELGHENGRTGCRDVDEAAQLATLVAGTPGLRLAGVAGYEGTIGPRDPQSVASVDIFLTRLRDLADQLLASSLLAANDAVITAGGSVYFDRVADILGGWGHTTGATIVLRSGCYLIHDHGMYATATPAAAHVQGAPHFEAALSVWARVVSVPEPGLALADAGRRDLSHDAGLPVPLERVRAGESIDLQAVEAEVTALSDQHTFVRYPSTVDVRPGDLVRLGISHPCTTLDRHRALFVVDDADHVIGVVETQF